MSRDELCVLLKNQTAQILHIPVESIEGDQNLFDLGMHSLTAMQIVVWIRSVLKVELDVRDMFKGPSINGLANAIHSKATPQT